MVTTPDPFAQSFDSIEIERAPSPHAIETAFAAIMPGYFLLDDAGGRFVVDREMGVVMLRDEALLAHERGAVYAARLRVVEASGASYDLDLKLRVTGLVPQMLGAEEFSFGGEAQPAPSPSVAWAKFAPVLGAQTPPRLDASGAYGALLQAPMPQTNERIVIALGERTPAPAPAHATWSL